MKTAARKRVEERADALFVSVRGHFGEGRGGVQICTREYFETLEAAGLTLTAVEIDFDRRFRARVRRRIRPYEYDGLFDVGASVARVAAALHGAGYVFLNHRLLAPLAEPLREALPHHVRIVLLSHGLASVDYLHEIDTARRDRAARAFSTLMLGRRLLDERRQNRHFDHVFCLAPFEAEIERWLGARGVTHLPRRVAGRPLEWRPEPGRLGFVGRLDHGPNAEGLLLFVEALERIAGPEVRLRVVGSPPRVAHSLLGRFGFCEYLGALAEEDLEREASTWACFVHPLFCYARGCSTKLAVALGWRIPFVTTPMGCRGYAWRGGNLPVADDPDSLARLALRTLEPEEAAAVRTEIAKVADSSPTLTEVAGLIRSVLLPAERSSTATGCGRVAPSRQQAKRKTHRAMASALRRGAQRVRHLPGLRSLEPLWGLLRVPYAQALTLLGERGGIEVRVGGYPMKLHPAFAGVGWETVERESYRIFAGQAGPGSVVCDVGAHVGTYTILALTKADASAHVVAYEPHDVTFRYLEQHLVWNGVADRVTLRPVCCGSAEGTAELYCAPGTAEGRSGLVPVAGFEKKPVPMVTLDGEAKRLGIVPSVIKIDVEGAEWEVLKGGDRLLRQHHPSILLSLHPDALARVGATPEEVFGWLAARGYEHHVFARDHEIHALASAR